MLGQPSYRQFRMARAYLGWTQKEVADRLSLDKSAICRFEKGHTRFLGPATVNELRALYEERNLVFTSFEGVAKRPG